MITEEIAETEAFGKGLRLILGAVVVNLALSAVKITAGVVGNSYALVADGVESLADALSSIIVWSGLRLSGVPPDEDHPFGHGKAESVAALVVSIGLIVAAFMLAIQCIREILVPHEAPSWLTLPVLVGVVVIKELLFHRVQSVGKDLDSNAMKSDAWHQRSDAITSAAVFIGILIAVVGGKGYEAADDWVALLACGVIAYNGFRLLKPAVDDVMDTAAPQEVEEDVRKVAEAVEGVVAIEKCRIRKCGLQYHMDIHVVVDGELTVLKGHRIGHDVKTRLMDADRRIMDVVVHVEPDNDEDAE